METTTNAALINFSNYTSGITGTEVGIPLVEPVAASHDLRGLV